ncbi:unknown [Mycoplasma sp. CAG:956]|nr:unknown [Mycoplasma sp. CAG:956]
MCGQCAFLKEKLCLYIGSESILKLLCTSEIQLNALDEPYALFIFDNEDYSGITNALIDEVGLYQKNYNLIIDNADNLNKIIRLNTILENSQINNTKLYYISRNKENIRRNYSDSIIDKFNKIIDANLEMLNTIPIGNYDEYPNLVVAKNNYINPDAIKLN